MGQAKKELEKQEEKRYRKEEYLKNSGYNKCVECQEMFTPEHEEIICQDCWVKKIAAE